ncbi:MAG: FAD-dependent oxidoreductase [Candidatus Lokiarchaeota archaeon]|nr:FAD-dependent oxidoreductase [Candidatus Lokiarchaeota archaeon]
MSNDAPTPGYYREPEREVPIVKSADVVVVGGSQSGVAAAVCAARHGAKVLLVERNCFLGGQSVATMVVQWEKRAFINNLGAVATRGIARELLDSIVAKGGSDTLWTDPPGCEEMRNGEEWLDVEAVKFTLLKACIDAGVEILFDATCVGSMVARDQGNPRVTGIVVENRSGRVAIQARAVVDASAYLDVVWHVVGEQGIVVRPVDERMGPGWYTVFDGVDSARFVEHVITNGGATGYPSLDNPAKVRHHLATNRLLLYRGFADALDRAHDDGVLDEWPEDTPLPFLLNAKWWGGSRWCTSLGPVVKRLDAMDGFSISHAEITRQRVDWIMAKVFKYLPGWERAYLSRTSIRMGLRETRILKAVTMLTRDDIFSPDHARPDTVGRSGAHDPGKNRLREAYPIPYGIMVPERLDGVICCSRAIGAKDKTALDAHRGITPTMVVGQAAGTAAALSIQDGVELRHVDLVRLRSMLRSDGVALDVEVVDLPTIPARYRP